MATTTVPALTTVFTPPASCFDRTYTLAPTGVDSTDKAPGDDGMFTAFRGYSSECFPSQATLSDGYVYMSPAICPSAYSIATQWLDEGSATYAYCCPWYMHASESYWDCGSFPETTSMDIIGYDQSVATAGYAWDTPIMIAWKSSDLSILEHHPTAVGTWNSATNIPSPASATNTVIPSVTEGSHFINLTSSAPEAEVSSATPAPATGLSTGAKAGIGVGVALGVVFVSALVAFLLWRRKKAKYRAETDTIAEADSRTPAQEVKELPPDLGLHEASGESKVHEMGGHYDAHEMPGDHEDTKAGAQDTAAELEGSSPREMHERRH
ncbi:hypothetical protein HII31_06342 [Pseudocercospora fuligena]|uniref:LPXTG-domain-containing protein n=1 Tax=Pseudocercospora fuligena TaxID=685502 RepID=A0A8H6VI12_9PEZI|nr:hypothetical protein HII31_06342 [Pseudocercospora fuligena]